MKRNSILLCSAALALLSAGAVHLVAKDPAPATEPQKTLSLLSQERRNEAETAILRDVISVLMPAGKPAPSPLREFSRARVVPRSQNTYELALTDSAPGGVTLDPVRVPFIVQQPALKDDAGKPSVFVSGFYDTTTKSVQLYSAAGKTYVAAAEHPFIKTRTAKK
jgi:hypothetical protein